MTTLAREPKTVIYGLSCVCHPERGIRYVGQTRQGARTRFFQHRYSALHPRADRYDYDSPVHRWMRKHGIDNIGQEVLEVLDSVDQLDSAESAWIERLGLFGTRDSLNLTLGGSGVRGLAVTPKARGNIRAARIANPQYFSREFRDAASRRTRGSKNWNAILTESQVKDIKVALWRGEQPSSIAKEYGVARGMIQHINGGFSWAHILWPIGPRPKTRKGKGKAGVHNNSAKLTEDDVREIRRLVADEGKTYVELASQYNMTPPAIGYIVRRKTWKHVE